MNSRQQEEAFFEAARQLSSPVARAAFLDLACAGQPELRARLESLLAGEKGADQFFERAAPAPGRLVKSLLAGQAGAAAGAATAGAAAGAICA